MIYQVDFLLQLFGVVPISIVIWLVHDAETGSV